MDTCLEAQTVLLDALPRRLSAASAALAEGPDQNGTLTTEELHLALQLSRRGSTPGVDGLPYEFYRTFGALLVPVLLRVFNAAFRSSDFAAPLQPLLVGVLCLLLKPGQPADELSSYRPLTLLNCDVKLLMLVLSNRLQRPLDYVIDVTQSAFLRGRDISDNVRYHLGLASRLAELGLPGWLLHSDLTKAYDTADRGWLLKAMQAVGLRQAGIVRWCSLLLSGTQAQVRINGYLTAPFPVKGGLSQGGSLSCQEWVILLEPCLAYLNQLRSLGRLHAFLLPSGDPAPAACAFADDVKSFLLDPAGDGLEVKAAFQLAARAGLPALSVPKTKLLHLQGPVPAAMDGPQPPPHAITGFRVQPVGQPHRLLGVPFGGDEARCQQAAFGSMAVSMRVAGAPWAPIRLNGLGRAHVAMQCLAAKFVYQANFRMPPPVPQAAMQRSLNHFVGTTSWPEEVAPFQGQLYPRFAVSALPLDQGGLGVPHVRAHALAMQAKTAWLLFRHSSHPWLALFRHEVVSACDAVSRVPPAFHCLVTDPARVSLDRLRTPLARSAVKAFLGLGICRTLDLSAQSPWSVLIELTFHNAPTPGQEPLYPSSMGTDVARQWLHLQDVRVAALARDSLPPPVQADLALVLAWLPGPWRVVVCSATLPVPAWSALAPDAVRGCALFAGPDPISGVMQFWELWPSGRLHPLPEDVPHPHGPGRPAFVALRPKDPTAWTRADYTFHAQQQLLPPSQRQPLLEPWHVGVWGELELDPTVWGLRLPHGPAVSLLELQVRHARQHIAHQLRLSEQHTQSGAIVGYREGHAAWPRAWRMVLANPLPAGVPPIPLEHQGLEGLEARWRQSAAQPARPGPLEVVDWSPPWLDLASLRPPRAHPRERAQAAIQAFPAHPVLRLGFRDVWQRLLDPTLHRPFRLTCWRMLHGCLGCKAFLLHVRGRQAAQPLSDGCCEAADCLHMAPLETLTHAFLECPTASPAIDWLLATWQQLTGVVVPRSACVLLADDLEAWADHPLDAATLRLWTRLRVAVIGAMWHVRCSRQAEAGSFARRAIRLALHHLLGAVQRDWARTQGDLRHMDAGGFCVDWWRGVDMVLTVDAFEKQWAQPPLLCRVLGQRPLLPGSADARRLELLLSLGHPVPLPP